MCNFMSAIYTRTGEFYCNPEKTDSHEALIKLHSLKEGLNADNFVRVEFNPPSDLTKIADTNEWTFVLDERITPGWWEERKEDCLNQLHAKAKSLIVSTEIAEIRDRFVIIVEGAKIGSVDNCIVKMDGGTIQYVYGGTIQYVHGGTIQSVYGGTIQYVYGGTIQSVRGGTIQSVRGGTIQYVSGGTIQSVYGGTIQSVYGGTIPDPTGNATIIVYLGILPTPKDNAVVIDRRSEVVKVLTAAMAKKPRAKKVAQ